MLYAKPMLTHKALVGAFSVILFEVFVNLPKDGETFLDELYPTEYWCAGLFTRNPWELIFNPVIASVRDVIESGDGGAAPSLPDREVTLY